MFFFLFFFFQAEDGIRDKLVTGVQTCALPILLYEELVAHGQGSGENMPTRFSNEPETHRSSLGLFVTEDAYVGKNGYSLRLNGLDTGFNDHALERAIVMHGAPYVSADFAKSQG